MKQILIVLILCLIGTSQANSQTLLNDTICCVPCAALKKALILKSDNELLQSEIGVTRDSVNILVKQGLEKDTIITEHKAIITEKNGIINTKDQVITEKDNQISDLKHNVKSYRRQRNMAYITSGGLFILTIILLL